MFIITEFGVPHVADSLQQSKPLNKLAVMKQTWRCCAAFDDQLRYRCLPSHEPNISSIQRLLAHVCYNPITNVTTRWEPAGKYDLTDIVVEVEQGLKTDDDLIQQWFCADDVLKLLRSAKTFDQMADIIRCVCGEFESDPRLRAIVDKVLGAAPDSKQL